MNIYTYIYTVEYLTGGRVKSDKIACRIKSSLNYGMGISHIESLNKEVKTIKQCSMHGGFHA